jgi:hypothetical protein
LSSDEEENTFRLVHCEEYATSEERVQCTERVMWAHWGRAERDPRHVYINCETDVPERWGWSLRIAPSADATCPECWCNFPRVLMQLATSADATCPECWCNLPRVPMQLAPSADATCPECGVSCNIRAGSEKLQL